MNMQSTPHVQQPIMHLRLIVVPSAVNGKIGPRPAKVEEMSRSNLDWNINTAFGRTNCTPAFVAVLIRRVPARLTTDSDER